MGSPSAAGSVARMQAVRWAPPSSVGGLAMGCTTVVCPGPPDLVATSSAVGSQALMRLDGVSDPSVRHSLASAAAQLRSLPPVINVSSGGIVWQLVTSAGATYSTNA